MNDFKRYRELRGMTQKEVAFRLKVSVQSVSYWETGERMPSYDKLVQLAELYNTTTDSLLGRTENTTNEKKPTGKADGLDGSLVTLLMSLPEKDVQRVRDFVEGLKAAHKE